MNESALFCTTLCVWKLLVCLCCMSPCISTTPQHPSTTQGDNSLKAEPEGTQVYSYMGLLLGDQWPGETWVQVY